MLAGDNIGNVDTRCQFCEECDGHLRETKAYPVETGTSPVPAECHRHLQC